MIKTIKGFPQYTITEKGIITNTHTNYIIKPYTTKLGYVLVDLYSSEKKKIVKCYMHRLLMEHFVPNPENKKEVNRKDGDKTNYSLDNLEWVTPSENVQHAYDTGLNKGVPKKMSDAKIAEAYSRFMQGTEFEYLLEDYGVCAAVMSVHINRYVTKNNLQNEYKTELNRQKKLRQQRTIHHTINVGMYSKDNKLIKVFKSLREAIKYLNKNTSGPISNVLSGRQKTAYGYVWKEMTSTTIPNGSTSQAIGDGSAEHPEKDEDIV